MTQRHANLRDFDLNLLRVLEVLLRTRGVTRSAKELGMTQSGVSRALGRLRLQFADPLLVRDGRHMVPTAVAEQLRAPVGRLLVDADLLFISGKGFDPRTSTWAVRVGSLGYVEHIFLPRLIEALQLRAPGIGVHMVSASRHDRDALAEGRLDFLVDISGALDGADLVSSRLFSDDFCCVVRQDHPLSRGGLTLERFLELEHILVAPGGTAGGVVDELLAMRGLTRRVRAQVSSFTAPMPLIVDSDCVVTLPRRIAAQQCERWNAVVLPTPLTMEGFSFSVYWTARRRTELAHTWFRGVMKQTAAALMAQR